MNKDNPQIRTHQTPVIGFPIGWEVGLALVLALMAPFLLWPIELVIPFPVVIEELYKAGLVWLVIRGASYHKAQWVLLVAIAFSVSETLFYLFPALTDLSWGNWGWRWVTTVPMHLLTFLVQYAGWMVGAWPVGLLGAMGVHGGFNSQVR